MSDDKQMVLLELNAEDMGQRKQFYEQAMAIMQQWVFEGGALALCMMGHDRWTLPIFGEDVVLLAMSGRHEDLKSWFTDDAIVKPYGEE